MKVTGIIYSYENDSYFTLLINGKKTYFYLQKHLVKNFAKYLTTKTRVAFDCQEQLVRSRKVYAYKVNYFDEISFYNEYSRKHMVYYSLKNIRKGIIDLVNGINPIMFLDFEMNMQDFKPIANFTQEIIEAGIVLTNQDGKIYRMNHWYIKPTKFPKITHRAMKFLHYTKNELEQAVSFKTFYKEFKRIVKEFNPCIIVWGKSDILQFRRSSLINNCEDLDLHFVNLLQLHTNFFNLKDSPGLFKQWEFYNHKELPEQKHDSLEDARVTKEVFFNFKNTINEYLK